MVYKCVCIGCKSGYESCPDKFHSFTVPKDKKLLKQWQIAIYRDDIKLKGGEVVCEKHFHPEDILRERILYGPDGITVLGRSPYQIPRLRKGALPALLLRPDQKPEASRPCRKRTRVEDENENAIPNKKEKLNEDNAFNNNNNEEENEINDNEETKDLENLFNLIVDCDNSIIPLPISWGKTVFDLPGEKNVKAVNFHKLIGKKNENGQVESFNEREFTIDKEMVLLIKINGVQVDHEKCGIENNTITSIEMLRDIIKIIDECRVCQGCRDLSKTSEDGHLLESFTSLDKFDNLRHNQCPLLLSTDDSKNNSTCKCCKSVKHVFRKKIIRRQHCKATTYLKVEHLSPRRKKGILRLKKLRSSEGRAKQRAQLQNRNLKATIQSCQIKMEQMSEHSLTTLMKNPNLSDNVKTTLQEIFKASKIEDPRGRKYSDDWIVLCLLIQTRSPATYRMIRNLQILPLPHERTIRKYLAKIDCPCGFDSKFFELLKEHFSQKSEKSLHGILLLDEMSTRKGLLLDKETMRYKGVEDLGIDVSKDAKIKDLGKGVPKDGEIKLADHGLVLVFQSLYEDFSQPVAVFASSGPTAGKDLAKIVLQAITLLEKAGAKIHGVVSDGGAPNRKMWTELGCSGKLKNFRNYFQHPLGGGRKVFLFWDTPHLIKCIRNRLANSAQLKIDPEEDAIRWEYFQIMHDVDKFQPPPLKLCPKITDHHVNIMKKSFLKMRVSFAVQIFSKSVARGLRYYRGYEARLKNCETTAKFCERINDLFDALNRTWKNSETGLTIDGADMKILSDSLTWLNDWETRVKDHTLQADDFLTYQTAEGLRMTLKSTIDLSKYLLQDLKLDVVFTGRINQDPLERFFGTVRLAGGTNDHPATPTFLQIYKILSLFGILKPPNCGNCSVPNVETKPLISISRLKEIFHSKTKNKLLLDDIKNKLNVIIQEENSDFSDFTTATDHEYDLPPVVECLIYFTTGKVCKNITEFTKCETCRNGFFYSEEDSVIVENYPLARIVTLNSEIDSGNGLQHPNRRLFNFLKKIETSFLKHCNKSNVFELVVNEIAEEQLDHPCSEHAADIYAYIIQFYLEHRMRQFATTVINAKDKIYVQKIKASKMAAT